MLGPKDRLAIRAPPVTREQSDHRDRWATRELPAIRDRWEIKAQPVMSDLRDLSVTRDLLATSDLRDL